MAASAIGQPGSDTSLVTVTWRACREPANLSRCQRPHLRGRCRSATWLEAVAMRRRVCTGQMAPAVPGRREPRLSAPPRSPLTHVLGAALLQEVGRLPQMWWSMCDSPESSVCSQGTSACSNRYGRCSGLLLKKGKEKEIARVSIQPSRGVSLRHTARLDDRAARDMLAPAGDDPTRRGLVSAPSTLRTRAAPTTRFSGIFPATSRARAQVLNLFLSSESLCSIPDRGPRSAHGHTMHW